ncbi:MAG: sulfite exporter TauE/SafE family protein, partial [Planctomycetota bacterium]
MPTADILALLALGLVAGCLGGLLGIGGSIVMIPAMTLLLDRSQHLAQAAAMIVNVFVAVPALRQHQRARAVRWDVARRMLPAALVAIVVGVEASNRISGARLKQVFGFFLVYVIAVNVIKLVRRTPEPVEHEQHSGWPASTTVGGFMGFAAGLLGIGGGGIAVPLLQRVCNLPLRQCIATSTAVMCITAGLGAWRKNAALENLAAADGSAITLQESLLTAACLAPTAVVGGLLGAALTHRLPLGLV